MCVNCGKPGLEHTMYTTDVNSMYYYPDIFHPTPIRERWRTNDPKKLKRIQEEHLRNVRGGENAPNWRPCMHEQCPSCHGTGIKLDGSSCIHCIACPCPKCTVYC